jgi:hypothetical protein
VSQHPYLHYLYARERQRDFQRAAARYHLLYLARAGEPSPRERIAIWLADRLIAAGELLKHRYAPPTLSTNRVLTPVMDGGSSTVDHNGCGPDCVVSSNQSYR